MIGKAALFDPYGKTLEGVRLSNEESPTRTAISATSPTATCDTQDISLHQLAVLTRLGLSPNADGSKRPDMEYISGPIKTNATSRYSHRVVAA